ncbi:MAG: GTP 3',8-cyclase MoaA [Candidatus Bathyarchaeia archaeon]
MEVAVASIKPLGVPLRDRYGRPVTNLRISLNSSACCNFRCIHCHSEGVHENPINQMTPREIQRIVGILVSYGVESVKLTGGEPMLRRDIVEIVQRIKQMRIKEISMTTNGTHLARLAGELRDGGLNRVNISVHSLREDRYRFITSSTKLQDALSGVEAAVNAGLAPVKINMTLLRGVNTDEVDDMIRYVEDLGGGDIAVLQLIELVNSDKPFYDTYHMDLTSIEEALKQRAIATVKRTMHARHRYLLPSGVYVEVVRPMHNCEFCASNNRMRITYDGKFKPCLLREDNHVDFLQALRNGARDTELAAIYERAVLLREPYFKPGEVN